MIGIVASLRESDALRLGEDRGEVVEQKIIGSGELCEELIPALDVFPGMA